MELIVIPKDELYELIKKAVAQIKTDQGITEEPWLTPAQAMKKLNIKSKTTMQNLRDNGKVKFTQPSKKILLYNTASINTYLEQHSKESF